MHPLRNQPFSSSFNKNALSPCGKKTLKMIVSQRGGCPSVKPISEDVSLNLSRGHNLFPSSCLKNHEHELDSNLVHSNFMTPLGAVLKNSSHPVVLVKIRIISIVFHDGRAYQIMYFKSLSMQSRKKRPHNRKELQVVHDSSKGNQFQERLVLVPNFIRQTHQTFFSRTVF